MSSRRLFTVFWVWIAVLLAAYVGFPNNTTEVWALIGCSSVAAVVAGVTVNRPRRRMPWLLMALALLLLTVGDVLYLVQTEVLGRPHPFPSVVDVIYLAVYPLLIVGLLLLPRSTTGRDRGGVLDALILTAGIALLAWIFIIGPDLRDQSRSVQSHIVSISYPLFDILFLAAAARLLTEVRRTVSVVLLALGGLALLGTDILYAMSQLRQQWHGLGGPIGVGWIGFYAAWGGAALHPSMRELTEPRVIREVQITRWRLIVLTVSGLIAPVVLFVEPIRGYTVDAIPIAVLSAALFLLVLLRLAGVAGSYRQVTGRERSLREAGSLLVAATDVDTVRAVVVAAVGRLFPPGVKYEVALPLKADTLDDESLDQDVRESWVKKPAPTQFVHTDMIPSTRLSELREHEIALVIPLVVADRASGEPLIGTLVVAADDQRLVALQGALDVLAAQAALAIERIRLNARVARHDTERYFRTLVQSTADAILIVDDDDRVRYASPSGAALVGNTPLVGRAVADLVVGPRRDSARRALARARAGDYPSGVGYWPIERADGTTADVEVSLRDLRDEPTVNGIVLTVRDVTERLRLEHELTYLAFHDSLTGLANRVRFGEQVQQAVGAAGRCANVVGVLFVDVDDFKVVNDTMGHDVGDELLVEVGRRLSNVVGSTNLAARLGGDEFAILVSGAASPSDVERMADRVVDALAEPVVLNGSLLNASASIGVATTVDARGKGDLLRHADLALYVAKGSGKGRWRRYQAALHTQIVERMELRSALDRAVAGGDFALAYQPIVTLADGSPVGFEALLRWNDSDRGVRLPGEFIDVAEDSGLIVPIGEWVLGQALADAATWSTDAGPAPYLGINVSVRQFRSPNLIDTIRRELCTSGLPPQRLMLEITESLLLRDDERVWNDLVRLRDMGIRIAIDDFGTGYSSLSYLQEVPIDVLKIDKSFIDTMASSPRQRALVETIVRLARTLGLDVVAEGIQRRDDRDLLLEMGCPYGQGFLFAGPMSQGHALRWLRTQHVTQTA